MFERPENSVESVTSPEEQERLKRAVCRFFSDKLTELEVTSGERTTDYVQRFYELCTGSTRQWTGQKEFDMLGLSLPLRIRFDQHGDYAPELRRMSIDIRPLLQAQSKSELAEATISILEVVHHEAEHIFFPGELEQIGGIDAANREEWVAYASKVSEINAYARQFAFRYDREYHDEPFAIEKMQTLAERLASKNRTAYHYFVSFANPDIQKKYRDVADLAEVHRAIVLQTERHLELLKSGI